MVFQKLKDFYNKILIKLKIKRIKLPVQSLCSTYEHFNFTFDNLYDDNFFRRRVLIEKKKPIPIIEIRLEAINYEPGFRILRIPVRIESF